MIKPTFKNPGESMSFEVDKGIYLGCVKIKNNRPFWYLSCYFSKVGASSIFNITHEKREIRHLLERVKEYQNDKSSNT